MDSTSFEKVSNNSVVKIFITILGLLAAAITIYAFFAEKKVLLQYEIIADTNVLDINAEVGKLEILFDSTSLNKTNENLRIITLRVINKGGQNILNNFYDDNAPIGLEIENGKIIESPELISSSNNYISNNLKINFEEPKKFTFSKIILESEESFTLKLLVLHSQNEEPELRAIGKIAGQQNINVISTTSSQSEVKPFIRKTFEGNFWVQIVRLITYFLTIVVIIIIIAVISDKISGHKKRKSRLKILKEFKNKDDYNYSRMDDAIFDRFLENGNRSFLQFIRLSDDEKLLNKRYRTILDSLKNEEMIRLTPDERLIYRMDREQKDLSKINEMIEDGILIKDGNKLIINQPMRETLLEFSKFIDSKMDDKKYGSFSLVT